MMETRKDWYSFLSDQEKSDLADTYRSGPQAMVKMGDHWGDGKTVICAGDEQQSARVSAKLFRDKFHAKPCPMGHYGQKHGGPPLPPVRDRLRAEGYL